LKSKLPLGGFLEIHVCLDVPFAGTAQCACDTRIGILKVRRGIAFEGQHAGPIEHVIRTSVLGQVEVFDRTDAHDLSHRAPIRFGQFRTFLRDEVVGALRRLR
jgi:hypothetical protein